MSRIRRISPGLGRGGLIGNTEGPESYLRELDTLPSQFCRATGGTETVISQGGKFYRVHTFTDPDPTSLLLNFDGANGSTTFTDDSGWGHAVTANGNAQISTTQSRFGGSSLYLDGNGDYVDIPYSPLFSFGTADWTVEAMVYFAADVLLPVAALGTGIQASPSHKSAWSLYLSTSGITLDRFDGVTQTQKSFGGFSLPLNEWFHIAVCRDGGNLRAFVDGVQKGSTATSLPTYAAVNTTDPLRIGYLYAGSANYYGNGYIDSLRITKGQALYTAAFAPPTTALTRVGSGSLTFSRGGAVEYLVVGGGGGGGSFRAGGGGGGGYRSSVVGESSGGGASAEPKKIATARLYNVNVGAGGAGGRSVSSVSDLGTDGGTGQNSSFDDITSFGGGGGGNTGTNGVAGGSGGGGGGGTASQSGGSGESSQGYAGGDNGQYGAGGGGGAGAAGASGVVDDAGDGGDGVQSSIDGTATYRCGGGGGSTFWGGTSPSAGSGGLGGGTSGGNLGASDAAANTGGGGGGGGQAGATVTGGPGGDGGSGIVIVRYQITQAEYEAEAA